jgi:enoyl-[acyl-carrier protein] reductase/trans-2-enoyl-CoA reductase (NAD+)
MRDDIQEEVAMLWPQVSTDTLPQISDIVGYRAEFLRLFGFGLDGINYEAETDPMRPLPSAS